MFFKVKFLIQSFSIYIDFKPLIKQVEVMTLKNFEEIFGFDNTMEWEPDF